MPETSTPSKSCQLISEAEPSRGACPPDKPYCWPHWVPDSFEKGGFIIDCVKTPGTGGLGKPCALRCADGLNCAMSYPDPSAEIYRCLPMCTSDEDCPVEYPFCNSMMWPLLVHSCGQCDPRAIGPLPDCPAATPCRVRSASAPPSCGPNGSKKALEACGGADDCITGHLCVCTVGGNHSLGDDCKGAGDAICRRACYWESKGTRGECAAGQLCKVVDGSTYAYCE